MTHDTWHMTHDTWHMTHDTWWQYTYCWTFPIFMLMLMLDLWPRAETPGATHFGAYHRPPDGHFLNIIYWCWSLLEESVANCIKVTTSTTVTKGYLECGLCDNSDLWQYWSNGWLWSRVSCGVGAVAICNALVNGMFKTKSFDCPKVLILGAITRRLTGVESLL